jgi:peptidylprolyl isomerase
VITSRTAAALFLTATLALSGCGDDDVDATATSESNTAGSSAYSLPAVTANATDLGKEPKSAAGTGTPPATVQTKDLVVGTGATAKAHDSVTVHYVGSLYSDGSVFDSSWSGKPLTFSLDRVVPGFAQGIEGMKIGGRRQIVIPAELGYGAQAQPGLPANSVLVFIVDLKAIK